MTLDPELLALPFYEPEHRAVAERIDGWTVANAALWAGRKDPGETGAAILRALGYDGWFAEPLDCRSLCLVRESLAYADDLADFTFAIQSLASSVIARHGDEAQRARWLPELSAGRAAAAFAASEHAVGSDLGSVALRAERTADGYVLHGDKAWIAQAGMADVFCVIARTGEGPGMLGLTAFLVPAITPGLRVSERVELTAPRDLAHLDFDHVALGADAVLGGAGRGFAVAVDTISRYRVTVGAAALGFARRAADLTAAHVRGRAVAGGLLAQQQTVQARLADIETELNAAALLVARAAWALDQDRRDWAVHSSIAKLFATERAQEIVDTAVQLHGAAGLVAGSATERLYREIRSLRIYEGASEVQRLIIFNGAAGRRMTSR